MKPLSDAQRYERDFYNARLTARIQDNPEYGVAPLSPGGPLHSIAEDRVFFDLLGDLEGKILLDICCGTGKGAIIAAMRGAKRVVGVDVSPLASDIARRNAAFNGVTARTEFREMSAEALDFPDRTFHVVTGIDALHHTQLRLSLPEISRVLCEGGKGVFIETSAFNPLMMFARRYLTGHFGIKRWQNLTEHPLTRQDFDLMAQAFSRVHKVGTTLLFELRRLPLLASREEKLHQWDERLFAIFPRLRNLCYYQVIQLTK